MTGQLRDSLRHPYAKWAIVILLAATSLVTGTAFLLSAAAPASLVLVALLAALLWALINPETAMVLLLLTLSLGLETTDITRQLAAMPAVRGLLTVVPTGSIAASDVLIGFLLFSALVRFARRRQHALVEDGAAVGKALGLYLAIGVITAVIASFSVPFARLGWSLIYLLRLAFSFAPFLILALLQPSRRWVWAYTALFAALALAPVVRTALQAWDPATAGLRRYFGLVSAGGFSAMGLGLYMGAAAGLGLAVPILDRPLKRRHTTMFAWAVIIASMLTIVLAQKRAPFVAMLVILVTWALLPPRASHRRWLCAGLLIAILVVAAILRGGIFDRTFLDDPGMIEHLREFDQRAFLPQPLGFLANLRLDPNITGRIAQWYRALEAAARYPMGVGYRAMVLSPYNYPHNLYLQIIDEASLVGLACFLWLMRSVLRMALRLWRAKDSLSVVLGCGLFCAMAGMLAQGMFDESLHNWDGMALLWLLAGLAAVQFHRQVSAATCADGPGAAEEPLR